MDTWGWLHRWRYGVVQMAGFGFVAGAFEAVNVAASARLALSWFQALILGTIAIAAMGVVGVVLGAAAGAPLQSLHRRGQPVSATLSRHLAGGVFLLTGFYLWQMAWRLLADGASLGAWGALAAMPMGFAGVAFFNARYWLRKVELGRRPALGWIPVSAIGSVLVVGGAAVSWAVRDPGGGYALEGDPNIVLITIDGLRRADVEAVGGEGLVRTPAIDGIARGGAVFTDAVTPTGTTRAANATVLSGLHPLRHKVLDDTDFLSRGYHTLPEVLADEGWATAGFVSSGAVAAGSGLEQGFRVYDDDFVPGPAGTGRLLLVQDLLMLARWVGLPAPWRAAGDTASRASGWVRAHGDVPFLLWVHLVDPAMRSDDVDAVNRIDDAVQQVVDAVAAAGAGERTTWVAAGSHGELRGAHGGEGSATLFDEVVRVPLVLHWHDSEADVGRVSAQVRTMDVATTVAVAMGLDPLEETEGVELWGYATGKRKATISTSLVGQDLDGRWVLGLRNNGVKVLRDDAGSEVLYDLSSDPGETTDLSTEQAKVLLSAQQILAPDQIALDRLR